jgi:hypothetical protein
MHDTDHLNTPYSHRVMMEATLGLIVQGIGHGDRRKAYRGPGAEAVIFPSQSRATVASRTLSMNVRYVNRAESLSGESQARRHR